MKLEKPYSLVPLSQLKPGEMMIINPYGDVITYAMRVVRRLEDTVDEYIVTLGSGVGNERYTPFTKFLIRNLAPEQKHVLKLDDSFELVPVFEFENLTFAPWSENENAGNIIIGRDRVLLSVLFEERRPQRPAYVDLSTGEFVQPDFDEPAVCVSRWRLVSRRGNKEETVFEHPANE